MTSIATKDQTDARLLLLNTPSPFTTMVSDWRGIQRLPTGTYLYIYTVYGWDGRMDSGREVLVTHTLYINIKKERE